MDRLTFNMEKVMQISRIGYVFKWISSVITTKYCLSCPHNDENELLTKCYLQLAYYWTGLALVSW